MRLSEITGFERMHPEATPAHQVDWLGFHAGAVAELVDEARNYLLSEAKASEADTERLSALLRGSMLMLRELGELIDEVAELAKGWTHAGPENAAQSASSAVGLPEAA